MSEPARKYATYEDLLAVPDHLVGQIVSGELIVEPRPASPHAAVTSVLGEELGPPFRRGRGGPGGWWLLDEPELHVGSDILVPDLAGWRRERMPVMPEVAYFDLSPDWICEVLSPRTERLDRTRKMEIYAREGVKHAWLINPEQKILEAFRLEGLNWLRVGSWEGHDLVRAEPFDAFQLELGLLWER